MSATLAGALKAYLEGLGLGVSVYDTSPPMSGGKVTAKRPYITVQEDIALVADFIEDGGPGSGLPLAEATGIETVQLDLWETWRDANDKRVHSATLPDAITNSIQGSRLGSSGKGLPPKRIYGITQANRMRVIDKDARTVRHIYTLHVHRVL